MLFATTYDLPPHVNATEIAIEQGRDEKRLGILSPECQKQREIQAIKLGIAERYGDTVQIIEIRKENNSYLVITDRWEMTVDVIYLPPLNPDIIGAPQRFELKFHEPI